MASPSASIASVNSRGSPSGTVRSEIDFGVTMTGGVEKLHTGPVVVPVTPTGSTRQW